VAQYGKHIESPPYVLGTKRKAFSFHIKTNEMLSEPINAFSSHKKTSEMLSEPVNPFLLGHLGWGQRLNFFFEKKTHQRLQETKFPNTHKLQYGLKENKFN